MTSGLQPGDLIIVAGRPSMGKTTLAVNMAENAALGSKKSAAIFSMEMSAESLTLRMLSSLGRINQGAPALRPAPGGGLAAHRFGHDAAWQRQHPRR